MANDRVSPGHSSLQEEILLTGLEVNSSLNSSLKSANLS